MYAKDLLKNNLTGTTKSDVMKEITTGSFVGASIGVGIGLYLAYKREKSYLLYAFIGLLAGGVVTRVFIAPKKDKNG